MSQPFLYRRSLSAALLAALQTLLAPIVALGMLYLLYGFVGKAVDPEFVALAAIIVVLSGVLLHPSHYTSSHVSRARWPMVASILSRWGVLLGCLFAIGYATKQSTVYSRQVILIWAVATPAVLLGLVFLLQEVSRRHSLDRSNARRAIFAGCNEVSTSLHQRLQGNPLSGINCLGFFDDRGPERLGNMDGINLLGTLPDVAAFVKRERIEMIFIALPMRHIQRVMDLLDHLRDTTASIYYVPDVFVFDLIQARTGDFYGIPVVSMCETPFFGYRGAVKRLLDIVISATALILFSPIMLVIALLVRLSSPGPAVFKQKRYGLDGRQITVYKFRSMSVAEDGPRIQQARREDPRVTQIGRILRRTSLDELPQLINVLQGRMSLVGPRPHAVAHNEEYRKVIKGYMIRHKVLPGITGLAQVNGCRGETASLEDMRARVEFDLEYLRHWSPMLDVQILWRTFLMLFRRDEKAY